MLLAVILLAMIFPAVIIPAMTLPHPFALLPTHPS